MKNPKFFVPAFNSLKARGIIELVMLFVTLGIVGVAILAKGQLITPSHGHDKKEQLPKEYPVSPPSQVKAKQKQKEVLQWL